MIQREYDDFEFLNHVLTSSYDVTGVIVPPLPPRPALDASAAEARSRRQLGQATKTVRSDDFEAECRALDKYLVDLLTHPLFGTSQVCANEMPKKDARKILMSWGSRNLDPLYPCLVPMHSRTVEDLFKVTLPPTDGGRLPG